MMYAKEGQTQCYECGAEFVEDGDYRSTTCPWCGRRVSWIQDTEDSDYSVEYPLGVWHRCGFVNVTWRGQKMRALLEARRNPENGFLVHRVRNGAFKKPLTGDEAMLTWIEQGPINL